MDRAKNILHPEKNKRNWRYFLGATKWHYNWSAGLIFSGHSKGVSGISFGKKPLENMAEKSALNYFQLTLSWASFGSSVLQKSKTCFVMSLFWASRAASLVKRARDKSKCLPAEFSARLSATAAS